jgi:hypothetical protein
MRRVEVLAREHAMIETVADAMEAILSADRSPVIDGLARVARAQAALGDGRPAEAFALLQGLFDPADAASSLAVRMAAASLVGDAAVGAPRESVDAIFAQLAQDAALLSSPVLDASLRYAHVVLHDGPDVAVDEHFRRELESDLRDWPFLHARLQLVYGGWLRRRRRIRDARPVLRGDRKSTRLNSSHNPASRMPSSA